MRKREADKRGGNLAVIALDDLEQEIAGPEPVSASFDMAWLQMLLAETLEKIKEGCAASESARVCKVFDAVRKARLEYWPRTSRMLLSGNRKKCAPCGSIKCALPSRQTWRPSAPQGRAVSRMSPAAKTRVSLTCSRPQKRLWHCSS